MTTAQQLGSIVKSARQIMRKDKGLNGDLHTYPLFWHKSSEIFNALNNSEINSELKQQLAELKVKLGL